MPTAQAGEAVLIVFTILVIFLPLLLGILQAAIRRRPEVRDAGASETREAEGEAPEARPPARPARLAVSARPVRLAGATRPVQPAKPSPVRSGAPRSRLSPSMRPQAAVRPPQAAVRPAQVTARPPQAATRPLQSAARASQTTARSPQPAAKRPPASAGPPAARGRGGRLSPLQQAVVWAEVLGPPKALRREPDDY